MEIALLEVTVAANGGIRLDMTPQAFAIMLGYASLAELLEVHGTMDAAVVHWKKRWADVGIEVVQ